MNITALRMMFFVLLSTVINIHAMDGGGAGITKESLDIQQVVNAYWISLSKLQRASKAKRDSKTNMFEYEYVLRRFGNMSAFVDFMIENLARRKKVDELLKLRSSLEGINSAFAMHSGLLHSPGGIDNVMRRYDLNKIVEQKREKTAAHTNTKPAMTFTRETPCRQELKINKVPDQLVLVGEVPS